MKKHTTLEQEETALKQMLRKHVAAFLKDANISDRSGTKRQGNLHDLLLCEVGRILLELVLEHTRGNKSQAAEILGINRNTLRKKIKELEIPCARDKV
jgi:DNA-binding protein Fis